MAEETSDAMNSNLNHAPRPRSATRNSHIETLEILSEILRRRRRGWSWENLGVPESHFPVSSNSHNSSIESNHFLVNSNNGSALQAREGSVEANTSQQIDDVAKGNCNDKKFFECYICLDMASDPIVTSCGHLFCWSCIYQWLEVHSNAKECPVCKGKVIIENVTPIYSGGNNAHVSEVKDSDPKIPLRPQARRVDNVTQTFQTGPFSILVEEMLQRVGNIVGLNQDSVQPNVPRNARHEQAEIIASLLRRFRTSRSMGIEVNFVEPGEDVVGLVNNNVGRRIRNQDYPLLVDDALRVQDLIGPDEPDNARQDEITTSLLRMFMTSRGMRIELNFVEPQDDMAGLLHNNVGGGGRNQEPTPRVDGASRVPGVDSGDYRAPRRRRLN